MESGAYNKPGSPLAIAQGPQGYAGLPRGMGIGCLVLMVLALVRSFAETLRHLPNRDRAAS